jgi:hypothetical protein
MKKYKSIHALPKTVKASTITHVKRSDGSEDWNITVPSGQLTITTSSTSVEVMDDAVKLYANALKRLAKR